MQRTPSAWQTFGIFTFYYLISIALAHGHTVVTHEVAADTVKCRGEASRNADRGGLGS